MPLGLTPHRAACLTWAACVPFVLVLVAADPAAEPREVLMQLSHEYWETNLRAHPTWATSIGDHRYDNRLEDNSPQARERLAADYRDLLSRVEALDPGALSEEDRITHTALRFELQSDLASLACGLADWTVDPLGGPQVELFNIPAFQELTDDPASGTAMRERWAAMGPYLDQHAANLRAGLAAGKAAPRDAVTRVIGQIDELEATPVSEWALSRPARETPEAWPSDLRDTFSRDLVETVETVVKPALLRYREFLKAEVLPRARSQDKPGIMHVPGGAECYRAMILRHTSLEMSPEEIHDLGVREVHRINAEMRELGKRVLDTDDLETIHRLLREDPAMHFTTRDEVQAKAEEALARAEAAVPDWFGILPKAPCRVVRMKAHEEKNSTIAYYFQPATDGSRPGSYYINTYAPETRPRYEAEALAFHEAVPGHHLQIAIAQELQGIPEFRKHTGVTAYVEGWGLYTERLCDEMGLYSGDVDRIGMLSFDAWRACRLVVDTGMHALGWSRQQAIDYMVANTVLAENNIENEVDRYITWPGQALAYKIGQQEILRLRADARKRLGDRFDIKGFHDAVLGEGAVDLRTLDAIVARWVESVENGRE
jgi:uncharacterized protein (DUF885 family)